MFGFGQILFSKSNTFWTSMNTYNDRGALAFTNAPGTIQHALIAYSYFGTKEEKKY